MCAQRAHPLPPLASDLLAMDSFATGHRVWEVKMPISSMNLNAGNTIYALGGINYDKAQHWYPGELLWNSYAPITVSAVPEPSTYIAGLGAFGILGLFGWRNGRK